MTELALTAGQLPKPSSAQLAPVLLGLQQIHGNRYVQRVVTGIQAKLKVGQPGDKYEQEEEELQAEAKSGRISEVNSNLESHIQSFKGGGQLLSENDHTFFELRFGQDFSQVRLHSDAQTAESTRTMNAKAYTPGQDVVFGKDRIHQGQAKGEG